MVFFPGTFCLMTECKKSWFYEQKSLTQLILLSFSLILFSCEVCVKKIYFCREKKLKKELKKVLKLLSSRERGFLDNIKTTYTIHYRAIKLLHFPTLWLTLRGKKREGGEESHPYDNLLWQRLFHYYCDRNALKIYFFTVFFWYYFIFQAWVWGRLGILCNKNICTGQGKDNLNYNFKAHCSKSYIYIECCNKDTTFFSLSSF